MPVGAIVIGLVAGLEDDDRDGSDEEDEEEGFHSGWRVTEQDVLSERSRKKMSARPVNRAAIVSSTEAVKLHWCERRPKNVARGG